LGKPAIFQDIQQVAVEERRRMMTADEEPIEVQVLRAEAAQEAQRIILEAVQQADIYAQTARTEGSRTGYEQGYAEGLSAAHRQMEEERARYRAEVEGLVALIEQERRRIWQEAEMQIIAFVLEIAQKVVKDEAQINREVALSTVRNALRRVVDSTSLRIRVNAQDLDHLRQSRESLLSLVDGVEKLEIIEDRRVSPGGCVVETGAGTIDARFETQLEEIGRTVQQALREAA
jgi:flagellar assembly protein FliH